MFYFNNDKKKNYYNCNVTIINKSLSNTRVCECVREKEKERDTESTSRLQKIVKQEEMRVKRSKNISIFWPIITLLIATSREWT